MKPRIISIALVLVVVGFGSWWLLRPSSPLAPGGTPPSAATESPRAETKAPTPSVGANGGTIPLAPAASSPAQVNAIPSASPIAGAAAAPRVQSNTAGVSVMASAVPTSAPNRDPLTDVDKVRHMITDYHTLMGENPVGTNAEIMQALMGGNRNQATLGPPDGQTLNDKGELIDRWGDPYFFHQLSKDLMEIRSAGPDKVMWTGDDIIMK